MNKKCDICGDAATTECLSHEEGHEVPLCSDCEVGNKCPDCHKSWQARRSASPVKLVMIHLKGESAISFRTACPSCVYDHNGKLAYQTELAPHIAVPSAVKYCQMCGRK